MDKRTRNQQNNRPEDLPQLNFSDLRTGDVLLAMGRCDQNSGFCASDLIAKLDGGYYSHAIYFDGEKFVQATQNGVQAWEPVFNPAHEVYKDVYRFHDQDGQELGSDALPVGPLNKQSQALVDACVPYAYSELVLIAIILIVRGALPGGASVKEKFWLLATQLIYLLKLWYIKLFKDDEYNAIVCTELVSEIFWQPSEQGHPYGIQVDLSKTKARAVKPSWFARLLEWAYARLYPQLISRVSEFRASLAQHTDQTNAIHIAGSKQLPSCCITPRNLQDSPSLRLVGTYVTQADIDSQLLMKTNAGDTRVS